MRELHRNVRDEAHFLYVGQYNKIKRTTGKESMTMENTNQFDWVLFYQEFAEKLQTYKNRRKELCENGRGKRAQRH